jgi:CubicO group peptidase (beta-lactamase class C family)
VRPLLRFTLPLLALHVALCVLYAQTVGEAHRVREVDRAFLSSDAPLDVLVVGDSHPMNAVGPAQLGPRVGSIAVAGEHAIKTYYRLKWLLDQTDREIGTVVLPFGLHAFSGRNRDRYEPELVWGRYVDFWELGSRTTEVIPFARRWTKAKLFPYTGELDTVVQYLEGRRAFQDEADPDRFADRPERGDRRTAAEAAADHFEGHDPKDLAMVWAFKATVNMLHRREIDVVTVAYPVTAAYAKAALDLNAGAGRMEELQPMIERERLRHLDFLSYYADRPELFFDSDHLNGAGRVRFTDLLGRNLHRLGVVDRETFAVQAPPDFAFGRVDRAIETLLEEHQLPGATMWVYRSGDVLHQQAYGSYTLDQEILVGSASKWVSVAALMSVVDEGLLSLDDKISDYVPSFRRPVKSEITLRQAISHTSGLQARHSVINDYGITMQAAVEHIATTPLMEKPGKAFRYGALGLHAACHAAEVATGQRFGDIVEQRITGPLNMKATRYGRLGVSDNPGVSGNLITTPRDFSKFLRMILHNGKYNRERILSAESIAEMERGQTGGLPRKGHVPPRHFGTEHDLYGLGLWRDTVDQHGDLLVSSSPGKFGFTPWIDRRQQLAGVFAVQVEGPSPISTIPDPGGIQYMVCDIVDLAVRQPMKRHEANPACKRHVQARRER